MKIFHSLQQARHEIAAKHNSAILEDLSTRIPLTLAVPPTATLGELMEMLYWAKGWEPLDEVIGLPLGYNIRHWGFKVSVKAEYLPALLTLLYAPSVNGFVFEE